jgi:head-tail adaptor
MTLVSSRVSLTHLCTTQRITGTAETWTAPGVSWADHLTAQPCYGWTEAGREAVSASETVVLEDRRLILALGTDVTEADRVSSVTSRGSTVFEGPMGIEAVLTYPDHLELILTRAR